MKKNDGQKDKIEDFLKKNKISGLFLIPGKGTFSFFSSDNDRLLVLEHAKIEILVRRKIIESEAMQILQNLNLSKPKDKKQQSYIG